MARRLVKTDGTTEVIRDTSNPVYDPNSDRAWSRAPVDADDVHTRLVDYATALQSDAKLFSRFFRSCLDRGVYLAPSAYEAGFLSTAHDGPAIDRACEVLALAIREL